jgi:mRNA interferase MazF
MRRGELYRVRKPGGDPKRARVFAVVSRQVLLDSSFSTVVCAPVYSRAQGLSTQVAVGVEQGLKHDSAIFCDNLVSIPRSELTDYVGSLSPRQIPLLDQALRIALELV